MEQENNCWQCGKPLRTPPPPPPPDEVIPPDPTPAPAPSAPRLQLFRRKKKPPEKKPVVLEDVLKLDDLYTTRISPESSKDESEPAAECKTAPIKKTITTLTGELVEVEEQPAQTAATIGEAEIEAKPEGPIFIISFCRNCGFQNPEGIRECQKCRNKLEIVHEPPPELDPLPRAWGFDALGVAWIILGFAAMYSGIFLIKTDDRMGTTLSDYFWTLVVAAAPGILIFMRHVFCKVLFWVMSFVSLMIWLVIGFIWVYVGLQLSQNGEIGLTWFAVFSALSFVSWVTVRVNDEFDYSL